MSGSSDEEKQDKPEQKPRVDQGTSPIEWVAAGIGAVLLAVLVGYMAFVGSKQQGDAPRITVANEAPVRVGESWLVRFQVRNSGPATATQLVLKARLMQDDREVEATDVVIDYLPSDSERSGGFLFRNDPAKLRLEFFPAAYQDP